MPPLPRRFSCLGLIFALCAPLALRAEAQDDKKAPPSALDVLRGGAFGGRDSQGAVPSQGPSGGRSAARSSALTASTSQLAARVKTAVPSPAMLGGGSGDTILGMDKKVAAGLAAGAGIVLIAVSGGSAIPVIAGVVLLVGGAGYLGSSLLQAARNFKNPLDAAFKR